MSRLPPNKENKPPAGPVTILFTDLTNSTGMAGELDSITYREKLFDVYKGRLNALFGSGVVFQFKGDGYIAAFEYAKDAIQCAVDIQRNFASAPLDYFDPDSGKNHPAITRVSIYTSPHGIQPQWDEDDGWQYVDDVTNRAARLEGIAQSGQILFAQTTFDKLKIGIVYPYKIWEARLFKGISAPVNVYELLWEEKNPQTRGEPGQPFVTDGYFGENTNYIDRPDEEKAVRHALLDQNKRMVTIHASGGMGKTRLAYRCAAKPEITAYFTDGVKIIRLDNSLPSVESVKEAFCAGLDWKPASYTPETLRDELRRKKTLLVLDNYESVKDDAVRDYLRSFLANDAPLRFLVTSRDLVGLPAGLEQPVSLEAGMSDDQADALLLDRVRAAKEDPFWIPRESDRKALRQIREDTENVPLALELIAAWVSSSYTLPQIAKSVSEKLLGPFLTLPEGVASFDGKKRHLSLQESLEWSYEMLLRDEANRAFLAKGIAALSLFPESFSREIVEGACGYNEASANRLLTRLLKASLLREVETEDSKRYHYHRATREFAAEKLDAHLEAAAVRRRFIEYWAEWLGENDKFGDLANLALLRQEWRNVIAASEIAEKIEFWSEIPPLANLFEYLVFDGLYAESERLLRRAATVFKKRGDKVGEGMTLNNLGNVYRAQNKFAEAELVFNNSLVIKREFDDRVSEGRTLCNLGNVYQLQNKFAEAELVFNNSLVIRREFGDRVEEGKTLSNLALLSEAMGKLPEAVTFARQAVALLQPTQAVAAYEKAKRTLTWLEDRGSGGAADDTLT